MKLPKRRVAGVRETTLTVLESDPEWQRHALHSGSDRPPAKQSQTPLTGLHYSIYAFHRDKEIATVSKVQILINCVSSCISGTQLPVSTAMHGEHTYMMSRVQLQERHADLTEHNMAGRQESQVTSDGASCSKAHPDPGDDQRGNVRLDDQPDCHSQILTNDSWHVACWGPLALVPGEPS